MSMPMPETDERDRIKTAGRAGQMADLLRVLDQTAAAQRRDYRYNDLVQNALARQRFGALWPDDLPATGEDGADEVDMNINIDSPTTINQAAPQPAVAQASAPTPAAGVLPKIALAAVLAAGGGVGLAATAGWALGLFNRDRDKAPAAAPAQAEAVERPSLWRLKIIPEEPQK